MSALRNPPVIVAVVAISTIANYVFEDSSSASTNRIWTEWLAWIFFVLLSHLLPLSNSAENLELVHEKPGKNEPQAGKFDSLIATNAILYVLARCILLFSCASELQWALPLVPILTFVVAPSVQDLKSSRTSPRSVSDQVQLWQDALVTVLAREVEASVPLLIFAAISAGSALLFLANVNPSTLWILLLGLAYSSLMAGFYILMPLKAPSQGQQGQLRLTLLAPILRSFSIYACAIYSILAILHIAVSTKAQAAFPGISLALLGRACLSSIQYCSIICLCLEGISLTASTLGPAALALINSTLSLQTSSALLFASAATGTLLQTVGTLPRSTVKRHGLLGLFGLPIIALLFRFVATLNAGLAQTSPGYQPGGAKHPVAQLFEAQNARFQSMLAQQSTTLEQAVTRYQSRHHRLPPPGFDKWFEIAQSLNFQFIDEFDEVMASLEPFWGIAPATIRARLVSIEDAHNIVKVTVNASGTYMPNGGDWHLGEFQKWLDHSTWGEVLPETSFYISDIDEPRVVVPYDSVDLAVNAAQRRVASASKEASFPAAGADTVKWIDIGKQDAWEAFFSSCSISSPARDEQFQDDRLTEYPRFVANVSISRDICQSPTLKSNHAFFLAPESLLITRTLVPIFSQTKPTIFNDILYPSPYYAAQMEGEGVEAKREPDWEDKLDRLYWAGASTGGRNTFTNWRKMLRSRMTLLTAADSTAAVKLLQKGLNSIWRPLLSTWADISDLFYMRITNIVQCDNTACEAMKEQFHPESEPGDKPFENKYVLDMDGNSFSGRFYRLLRSKSCVLKQGIFNEWHDGRLIPWVHFIPVSPEGEELGEIIRYLTSDEDGQRIGKAIADQGRNWARKTLRYRDLEVAFVRILLEYARLLETDRDNLSWNTPRSIE